MAPGGSQVVGHLQTQGGHPLRAIRFCLQVSRGAVQLEQGGASPPVVVGTVVGPARAVPVGAADGSSEAAVLSAGQSAATVVDGSCGESGLLDAGRGDDADVPGFRDGTFVDGRGGDQVRTGVG